LRTVGGGSFLNAIDDTPIQVCRFDGSTFDPVVQFLQKENLLLNPRMKPHASAVSVLRTNILTNPATENLSGSTVNVRTNLATNSSMELSTTQATVRTNLVTNPRGVFAFPAYAGDTAQTITPNVAITDHPDGLTTANRVTYGTSSNPGVAIYTGVEASTVYSISAWVYHESLADNNPGTHALAQAGVLAAPGMPPLVTGKWIRVTWQRTTAVDTTSHFGYRVSGQAATSPTASFLITGVMVEKSFTVGSYFDGSTKSFNECKNPSFETDLTGWTARWYGNTGGSGTFTRSAGNGMNGNASGRKTWNTANTSNAVDVGIGYTMPVAEGQVYTASVYQKASWATGLTIFAIWMDAASAVVAQSDKTNYVLSPAGTWVRHSQTLTAPAGAAKVAWIVGPYTQATPAPQGGTIDWDWMLVEDGSILRKYYDDVEVPSDFLYQWSGTADASNSLQRVNYVGNVGSGGLIAAQSTQWALSGTKSLRTIPLTTITQDTYSSPGGDIGALRMGMQEGKTYTISATCRLEAPQTGSLHAQARRVVTFNKIGAGAYTSSASPAAPNVAGSTRLSLTYTVPAGTTEQFVRLYNGAQAGNGDVWWDDLLIEEVDVLKPYFDGTYPAETDYTYAQTGADVNSSSVMRANMPSGTSNTGGRVGHSSSEWAANGTKSIRIPHAYAVSSSGDTFIEIQNMLNGYAFKPNTNYTMSATCRTSQVLTSPQGSFMTKFRVNVGAELTLNYTQTKPNTAGASRVVATFTTPAATNVAFIRLYNGTAFGGGDVWWDEIVLEEGITDGSYFDGANPAYQNLIWNNSFEVDTQGWGGAGMSPGVISRVTDQAYIGTSALKVVCSGASVLQGAFTNSSRPLISTAGIYTCSAWVKAEPGTRIAIEMGELNANTTLIGRTQSPYTTADGTWQRLTSTRTMTTGVYADMVIRNIDAVPNTLYVDAVMMERAAVASPYFSGTGDFTYSWAGAANQSLSYQRGKSVTTSSNMNGVVQTNTYSVATGGPDGGPFVRTMWINNSTDGGIRFGTRVDGQPRAASVWVRSSIAQRIWLSGWRYNAANGYLGTQNDWNSSQVILTPNTWTLVTGTVPEGPAESTWMTIFVRRATGTGNANWTPGATLDVGPAIVSLAPEVPEYFDGGTMDTVDYNFTWTGLPDASTSVALP
jgi:hypothetical protein